MGRRCLHDELPPDGHFDLGALTDLVTRERARALLICSPHNPLGAVSRRDELEGVVALAHEHDLWLVSDEIHADLTFDAPHIPLASIPGAAERTITLTSASKAFNIAGLLCATIILGTPEMLEPMGDDIAIAVHGVGTLGIAATLAAWSPEGEQWLRACIAQLDANRHRLAQRLAAEAPELGHRMPESTYLAWLDLRAYDLGDDPAAMLLERARIALSPGPDFGPPGRGHARLNFATTPAILDEIIDRLIGSLRA